MLLRIFPGGRRGRPAAQGVPAAFVRRYLAGLTEVELRWETEFFIRLRVGNMQGSSSAQGVALNKLQLAIFSGEELSVHVLPAEGRVALGRADDNDIVID